MGREKKKKKGKRKFSQGGGGAKIWISMHTNIHPCFLILKINISGGLKSAIGYFKKKT